MPVWVGVLVGMGAVGGRRMEVSVMGICGASRDV